MFKDTATSKIKKFDYPFSDKSLINNEFVIDTQNQFVCFCPLEFSMAFLIFCSIEVIKER